jgi:RNA polymerase sigma factor (sigma-70 family)
MERTLKPEELQASPFSQPLYLYKTGTSQEKIDADIWRSFKQGDRKALDYVFEKYVRLLYAYGAKITRNTSLVEDSIQDLFVELWQRRNAISEVTSVKFYLLKSLRQKVIRNLARINEVAVDENTLQQYEVEVEFSEEFKIIQDQVSVEQRERLARALSHLTKRQREAVYLKFYEKVSYQEIAEIMNISIKAAYNLIGKAIDILRYHIKT